MTPDLPGDSGTKRELPRWWDAYWAALAECGVKLYAAQAIPIDESTPRKWLALNPWAAEMFAEAERDAMAQSTAHLLMEARRRARFGVERPAGFYKGKAIADESGAPMMIREYSDTLLIFLLKGAMPETFRERYDVNAKVGVGSIDDILKATEESDAG